MGVSEGSRGGVRCLARFVLAVVAQRPSPFLCWPPHSRRSFVPHSFNSTTNNNMGANLSKALGEHASLLHTGCQRAELINRLF